MLKKKLSALVVAAFVLPIGTAVFAPSFSASAETNDSFVTEITQAAYAESFTINEGTLTAFTVPETVTGYFKVVIPAEVRTIASEAFDGSVQTGAENKLTENLIAVDIPSTVGAILPDAFKNCSGILEVLNESDVTEVADTGLVGAISTVTNANDLSLATVSDANGKYLVVRNGATNSGAYTLVDYAGTATAFTLPAPAVLNNNCKTYSVYRNAFKAEDFTSVSVPEGVTEIGDSAFESCTALTALALPKGLLKIGANAFAEAKISSLTVPASVTEIKSSAFDSCTSLTTLEFSEQRTEGITLRHSAFANCTALNTVALPQGSTVNQEAFGGCTSLRWVYVDENTNFINVANLGETSANVAFFSTNPQPLIIFSSQAAYDNAITKKDDNDTFKNKHMSASTYAVNVNCYVGEDTQPAVYKRLHGKSFNYVYDEETASWNIDSSFSSLPVQAAHYASTVWYGERGLTNKITYEKVNELLADAQNEINLYCKETVTLPALSAEPVSWIYDEKISYDVTDLKQVLEALGCKQTFTDEQLAAIKFDVVFADEKGNVAATPDAISMNGVYSVSLSLKDEYGSWSQQITSSITVNVNTAGFNVVLIVFLVIGLCAVIVTVSTAIIRKRVQKKNKKKQLSQKEALEKYRAAGGKTTLK